MNYIIVIIVLVVYIFGVALCCALCRYLKGVEEE